MRCMPSFQVGEQVLVPAAKLAKPDQQPYALMPRTALAKTDRSICVDDGDGGTVNVASRLVHKSSLGFLVLQVGDFCTEATLLNPLGKSVLQFMRLLVPDPDLRSVSLRTIAELREHWAAYHAATSHVILIGHGSGTGLTFVGDGHVVAAEIARHLEEAAGPTSPKSFVSLACLTGRTAFGRPFSKNPICRDYIAPFQSVHGAAASQFVQSLFTEHLLDGVEIPYAYDRVAKDLVGARRFRRWRDGIVRPPKS
jgi:hypothetical protein